MNPLIVVGKILIWIVGWPIGLAGLLLNTPE
jgi:hypothetical protein